MIINVQAVASVIGSRMVEVVDANRNSFIHSNDFESVFEKCFNAIAGNKLTGDQYTKTYQAVEADPEIGLAYTVIKEMIADERQDMIQEQIEEESRKSNPKAYYGV